MHKIYKVGEYWQIGGAYGLSNERNMMLEIKENGPITVGFQPDYAFMFFKKGVYKFMKESEWVKKGETRPEWNKVDHAVVIYGWGQTEDGIKYWNC